MATGQTIIDDALLELGVGSPGDNTDQEIINHALRALNRMWSLWTAQLDPVYAQTFESLTWTAGQASQTIGSGGDLNTTWPENIVSIQTRKDTLDYTLSKVSLATYQETVLKSISTDYPEVFAYQRDYPLGIIYMWPTPQSALDVRITSYKPLTAFTLTGTITLPSGYEEALVKNLAIELANVHGKSARPELLLAARNAKEAIELLNEESNEIHPDPMIPGLGGGENLDILTND